jgi:cytochrome c peroxidase
MWLALGLIHCLGPSPRMSIAHPENPPGLKGATTLQIALGKELFFDPLLSKRGNQSCGTCHQPENQFGDNLKISLGDAGNPVKRHTPPLVNLAWGKTFFWDGRAASLEEQALIPIVNPDEMDLPLDSLEARLNHHSAYKQRFAKAFPSETMNRTTVAKALAAYERTLVFADAPYDRWTAGDAEALSPAGQRGFKLFNGKARCNTCHPGPLFTDHDFHNNGLVSTDLGRHAIDRIGMNREFEPTPYPFLSTVGAFKTPTLRQVALTPPYMHDGSKSTLVEVLEFYNRGGDHQEKRAKDIIPLHLTESEMGDLLAFIHALSDTNTRHTGPENRNASLKE